MSTSWRTTWIAGVAGALLLAGCGPAGGEAEARIAELEASLEQARTDLGELRDENEALEAELAALRDGEPPEEPPENGAGNGTAGVPQPLWTLEALDEQLRTLFAPGAEPPDGAEPGATAWQPFELPDEIVGETFEEIGLLGVTLLGALDGESIGTNAWESTARAMLDPDDDQQGRVVVLSWGFADDSVQGRDVRVAATRGEDGWQAGAAEVRQHCYRGVTDNLCL